MAAFFTVLLGGCALLLGYFLYDSSRQNFLRETEDILNIELEHILLLTTDNTQQDVATLINKRTQQNDHTSYFYDDNNGAHLAGDLDHLPEKVEPLKEGVISFRRPTKEGNTHFYAAKIHTFSDGSRLLIARDIHERLAQYNKLKTITMLIMLFLLTVVLVSFIISWFVVTRINRIGNTATNIMNTGDLSERIILDSKWDDLSDLANILNTLFAQLEESLHNMRHAGDNIAHDLRTPLTRLRNRLETAKNEQLSGETYDALVGEVDNLLNTFNTLLRISNLEKGKRHNAFTSTNLSELLCDVIELYEPVGDEKNIVLAVALDDDLTINGDHDLLFQIFANLLDNAIKFSEKNSSINISLTIDNKNTVVTIADRGIGIPEDEHDKVFDRFYRTDKSRHHKGTGLGLSLVKQALDIHNATITFEDNNPGLKIVIRF